MKTFIGIDLGSTTTKAIVLDEDKTVVLVAGIGVAGTERQAR